MTQSVPKKTNALTKIQILNQGTQQHDSAAIAHEVVQESILQAIRKSECLFHCLGARRNDLRRHAREGLERGGAGVTPRKSANELGQRGCRETSGDGGGGNSVRKSCRDLVPEDGPLKVYA
jgi:hypothetical protein